jgi:Flp pilus assembly protein TadG
MSTPAALNPSSLARRRATQLRRRWHRLRGDERGYTVLDHGLSIVALIGVAVAVIQLCLVSHARHIAHAAAADALRVAADYQSSARAGEQDGYAYLEQVAPHLLGAPRISIVRSATTVTVTVHARVAALMPVSITQTVTGPVERLGGVPSPSGDMAADEATR